jgi:hypothetical protein
MIVRGRRRNHGLTNHLEAAQSRKCCFRALKLVAGWRNHPAANVSPSSNLLDGFAVETVENLRKLSVYTVCVHNTHCVHRFIEFCIQREYTLQINSGASKNVHPSHGGHSRERAAVEDAQKFSIS